MAGMKIKLPDESGRSWRTVDNAEIEISQNVFQDGLRVVDFERINTNHDENSVSALTCFTSRLISKLGMKLLTSGP